MNGTNQEVFQPSEKKTKDVFTNTAAGPTYRRTVAAARWLGKDAAFWCVVWGRPRGACGAELRTRAATKARGIVAQEQGRATRDA